MAKRYTFHQRELAEKKKARDKARKQAYRKLPLTAKFTAEMAEAHAGWMAGDEAAKKRYFSMLGKRGGKNGRGPAKKASGRRGGLQTKLVKRKEYVKGQQHGNFGKRFPKKPVQINLTPEQALNRLIKEVEYRIKNPDAHIPLTWEPGWKPPQIPKDTPVIDARGSSVQPGVPRSGEGEDTVGD